MGLREYTVGDWRVAPLSLDELPEFRKFVNGAPEMAWERESLSGEDAQELLQFRLDHYTKYGFGVFGVWDETHSELLAQVGLQVLPPSDADVELVVFVARRLWGTGLAYRLCCWTLDRAFGECALPAVWAVARPENVRALRLVERLGFSEVGPKYHYGYESVLFQLRNPRSRAAHD